MNKNNKNRYHYLPSVLTITFLAVTALLSNHGLSKRAKVQKKQPTLTDLQCFYKKWIIQEEKSLWNTIKADYGITKAECEKIAHTINAPESPCHALSGATKSIVDTVMTDFNMNQNTVTICGANHDAPLALARIDHIYLNETEIRCYPDTAKKFIVGHESRHIVHRDAAMKTALRCLLEARGIPQSDDPNYIGNKISRFFELRADIETITHSSEYAQGLRETMNVWEQKGLVGPGISHPKVSIRDRVGKNILVAHTKVNDAVC